LQRRGLGERLEHGLAGGGLLGDRDGVLEIENHRVGADRQRFLDAPRVVSGREQEGPQDRRHGRLHGAALGESAIAAQTVREESMAVPFRIKSRRRL
jgi:hypothetical protein